MPKMIGLDATEIIVVVTALGQQKMRVKALNNGAKDFLAKPFQLAQFKQVNRRLEVI